MRQLVVVAMLAVPAIGGQVWRPLFNGKDLEGWSTAGARGSAGYVVEDGAIRTPPGSGLLWYTRERIGNGTVRVIFRTSSLNASARVVIRIPAGPRDGDAAADHGIGIPIDDGADDWHTTGTIDSLTKALSRPAKPAGEWNTMDITLDGPRTKVKVNGALVSEYDGSTPGPARADAESRRGPLADSGFIALTHEGGGIVYFREISVRPLN